MAAKVVGFHVESYEDWNGDPALQITVFVDPKTKIEDMIWPAVKEIEDKVREVLTERNISRWPYFKYRKK
jgi:tRNA nucleotidyltransferase (CCA-adding enzyme)